MRTQIWTRRTHCCASRSISGSSSASSTRSANASAACAPARTASTARPSWCACVPACMHGLLLPASLPHCAYYFHKTQLRAAIAQVLLDELHEQRRINSASLWKQLYPVVSKDPRYLDMFGQPGVLHTRGSLNGTLERMFSFTLIIRVRMQSYYQRNTVTKMIIQHQDF